MKTLTTTALLPAFLLSWIGAISALAQGTIGFDQLVPGFSYTQYDEQGFRFRVVAPSNQSLTGVMLNNTGIGPAASLVFSPGGIPTGSTSNYLSFSRTDDSLFGLTSVVLRNDYGAGNPIVLQFDGYAKNGSVVSTAFTIPYLSGWINYPFAADFSSGLVRIDVRSASYPFTSWAMDNVVWVPEPNSYALLGLGLMAFVVRRFYQRQKKL